LIDNVLLYYMIHPINIKKGREMKKKKQRKENKIYNSVVRGVKTMKKKYKSQGYLPLSELCDMLHIKQDVLLKEPLEGFTIDCPDVIYITSFNQHTADYIFDDKKYSAQCSSLLVNR